MALSKEFKSRPVPVGGTRYCQFFLKAVGSGTIEVRIVDRRGVKRAPSDWQFLKDKAFVVDRHGWLLGSIDLYRLEEYCGTPTGLYVGCKAQAVIKSPDQPNGEITLSVLRNIKEETGGDTGNISSPDRNNGKRSVLSRLFQR